MNSFLILIGPLEPCWSTFQTALTMVSQYTQSQMRLLPCSDWSLCFPLKTHEPINILSPSSSMILTEWKPGAWRWDLWEVIWLDQVADMQSHPTSSVMAASQRATQVGKYIPFRHVTLCAGLAIVKWCWTNKAVGSWTRTLKKCEREWTSLLSK